MLLERENGDMKLDVLRHVQLSALEFIALNILQMHSIYSVVVIY